MRLREATAADLPRLVELWYDLATEMERYDDLNALVYESRAEVPEDPFQAHLDSDDVTEYLVEVDGDTVGFATTRRGEHPSREYSNYTRLVNLFIEDGHRGRGYGSAVVDEVRRRARESGCDHLKVSCEWDNRGARSFYEDAGFEEKQVEFAQKLD
ncbi:GNAT family N-acetyltransferase [Haloferax sp. Q22]|uniref:GNAT family N-acetyltransferase n=1 Tax=Haloferax sp. (strain Q22) TaxID=1526048 RepID=UPI000737C0AB|nr:GNAT family N-acetyltransferase [Haloferax sp. Q22]